MIESHVYVIITCDLCGKTEDFEEYDEVTTDAAESSAKVVAKKSGWQIGEQDICPSCDGRTARIAVAILKKAGFDWGKIREKEQAEVDRVVREGFKDEYTVTFLGDSAFAVSRPGANFGPFFSRDDADAFINRLRLAASDIDGKRQSEAEIDWHNQQVNRECRDVERLNRFD